jgi:hypothetical protein
MHALVDVVEVETTTVCSDEFGQLSGGFIKLKGKAFRGEKVQQLLQRGPQPAHCDFKIDDMQQFMGSQIAILPLLEYHFPWKTLLSWYCLLIKPVDLESNTYERAGMIVVEGSGYIRLSSQKFEDWIKPPWPVEDHETVTLI